MAAVMILYAKIGLDSLRGQAIQTYFCALQGSARSSELSMYDLPLT